MGIEVYFNEVRKNFKFPRKKCTLFIVVKVEIIPSKIKFILYLFQHFPNNLAIGCM